EVGLTLTRKESLQEILKQCAQTMAQYLNPSVAQILIYDAKEKTFETASSAGPLRDAKEPLHVAAALLDVASLAQQKPLFIKDTGADERLQNEPWIRQAQIASYVAHPLLLEARLVGGMGMFT